MDSNKARYQQYAVILGHAAAMHGHRNSNARPQKVPWLVQVAHPLPTVHSC